MEQYDDIPKIMRRHKIEPCAFILSIDKEGKPNGMIAGWNTKVSYDPPMIAVAVSKRKNTQRLIHESKEFVVASPSPELREAVEYFGSVSGTDVDKFKETGVKILPATKIKTPLLADARVNFECKLHSFTEPGDHYIFIGEIVAAHYDEKKKQLFYAGRDEQGNRVFRTD